MLSNPERFFVGLMTSHVYHLYKFILLYSNYLFFGIVLDLFQRDSNIMLNCRILKILKIEFSKLFYIVLRSSEKDLLGMD